MFLTELIINPQFLFNPMATHHQSQRPIISSNQFAIHFSLIPIRYFLRTHNFDIKRTVLVINLIHSLTSETRYTPYTYDSDYSGVYLWR